MKRTITTALAALALSGAVAVPAVADDASLRAAVEHQENSDQRVLRAFSKATDAFHDSPTRATIRRLRAATAGLIRQLRGYERAVTAEEPTSEPFAQAKRDLLKALGQARGALVTFDRALGQLLQGRSARSVLRTLKSSARQLDASDKASEKALDVLIPGHDAKE
jgi:hypothetical protein